MLGYVVLRWVAAVDDWQLLMTHEPNDLVANFELFNSCCLELNVGVLQCDKARYDFLDECPFSPCVNVLPKWQNSNRPNLNGNKWNRSKSNYSFKTSRPFCKTNLDAIDGGSFKPIQWNIFWLDDQLGYLHAATNLIIVWKDCLCGLVVRVTGYRSRGSGSILDVTTFFEK
jgi:hypothetical protein